jgi:hypothetical protein
MNCVRSSRRSLSFCNLTVVSDVSTATTSATAADTRAASMAASVAVGGSAGQIRPDQDPEIVVGVHVATRRVEDGVGCGTSAIAAVGPWVVDISRFFGHTCDYE